MRSPSIEVVPASPVLGARILGIDLTRPLSDAVLAEIQAAWREYLVLVFPDQRSMTVDDQIVFSKRLGPLDSSSLAKKTLPGHPQIFVIGNAKRDGQEIGARVASTWHSDGQYLDKPTKAAFLHSQIVPPVGGDTQFANMYMAYDALPEETRQRIDGLKVVHSRVKTYPVLFPNWPPLTEDEKATMPDVVHPLVRTHPDTCRKCLYVGGNSGYAIEGMELEEGRVLLKELRTFATQDRFVYIHKWTLGEALLWDNRCTMHCPPDYDHTKYERLMYRATIMGDRPF